MKNLEDKKNKPLLNLGIDCYSQAMSGDCRHAEKVMIDLGISYEWARGSAVADCWFFWNCSNVPENLPTWLYIREQSALDDAPWWLTQEVAHKLEESRKNG